MFPRIISFFVILFVVTTSSYSQQRTLQLEDKSDPFGIFSGIGNEAGMVFICAETIELTFSSNKDATVNVFKTELKGSDKYYYMRMPTGEVYNDRKLTIYAARYAPLIIELRLQTKELKTLYLFDPDIILQGCYNQTMKEGLEIFRMAQYLDAKAKYRLAAECSDAPATVLDDIQEKIAIIDTIIKRRRLADEFFATDNFIKAYDNYSAVFGYNPGDRYAELRMTESRLRLGRNTGYATGSQIPERRRQRTFVIQYETPTNDLFGGHGGSLGWYRDKKVGVCFAGRSFYQSLQYNYRYYDISEASASMGLTFRLFRMTKKDYRKWPWGVWMSLGGGYTWAELWGDYDNTGSQIHSVVPEAGLLMKMGFLTVKYSYQYRHELPSDYVNRSFLGLGFCF
jgi:hypothetical protein